MKTNKTAITKAPPKADSFLAAMRRSVARLKVTDPQSYAESANSIIAIDRFLRGPEMKAMEKHTKDAKAVHKQACEIRDSFKKALQGMKEDISKMRVAYQEQIRIAEEKRQQREGAKLHERQIEEAKEQAQEIIASGGSKREAAAIVKEAVQAPVPTVAPKVVLEKPKGFIETEVFHFEITDPSLVPVRYRSIDESLIRKDVDTFGMDADIPGVRIWSEKKEHTRGTAA